MALVVTNVMFAIGGSNLSPRIVASSAAAGLTRGTIDAPGEGRYNPVKLVETSFTYLYTQRRRNGSDKPSLSEPGTVKARRTCPQRAQVAHLVRESRSPNGLAAVVTGVQRTLTRQ